MHGVDDFKGCGDLGSDGKNLELRVSWVCFQICGGFYETKLDHMKIKMYMCM